MPKSANLVSGMEAFYDSCQVEVTKIQERNYGPFGMLQSVYCG